MMERQLQRIAKYSVKLLNAYDDLAFMMAREKQHAAILAATIEGGRIRDLEYVPSFSVALEECCNILLKRP